MWLLWLKIALLTPSFVFTFVQDQITFTSEAFFNNPIVKNALHVDETAQNHFWHGCQAGSGRRKLVGGANQYLKTKNADALHFARKLYMDNDRPLSVVPYIAELLDDYKIPVLIYNGDRDMTTNMVGTELALNAMDWNSAGRKWLDAPRGLWKRSSDDYPAGWAKEYKNLTYTVVYNSGHMVPYNVPDSAYDLLTRFLTGKSFIDLEAPQIRIDPIESNVYGVVDYSNTMLGATSLSSNHPVAPSITATGHPLYVSGVALVATVIGFVLGLMVQKRRSNYQHVPEADL